jgi:U3 small nucleolar RNA-associated protein 24
LKPVYKFQGKAKKTRQFAVAKRILNPKDGRLKQVQEKLIEKKEDEKKKEVHHV